MQEYSPDLNRKFSTPMMMQFMEVKRQYPDCLLFFRLGDFYELFLDDALIGAKVLNITLTARPRGKDGDVPMAGVPYHAAEHYLAKLVKAGYKVAICEQITQPSKKGIVERAVVRIVTPGTILNENSLQQKENNHIVSISCEENKDHFIAGISFADISTGSFITTQLRAKKEDDFNQLILTELLRFKPSECIISDEIYNSSKFLGLLKKTQNMNIFKYDDWDEYSSDAKNYVKKHFGVSSLRGFGIESKKLATISSATLLGYLNHTQQQRISHINKIESYKPHEFVVLDRSTIVNLELFETLREGNKNGSLLGVIDQTVSAAGGRLIKKWLLHPLKKKNQIDKRLNFVDEFLYNRNSRLSILEVISQMYDIERIVAKVSVGLANPGDLVNLKISLEKVLQIKEKLSLLKNNYAKDLIKQITSEVLEVIKIIEKRILPEPKIDVRSGGIINHGLSSRLDELRKISGGGRSWIKDFEQKQKEMTGINSLKVKYNKVFGYYIEVSKSNLESVPKSYYRKQTLVNAERFITDELKHYEDLILNAEDEIGDIEYELFLETIEEITKYTVILQNVAQVAATVDVLASFAVLAQKEKYIKPSLQNNGELKIIDGRHPVVEKFLEDSQFVPNDTFLNNKDQQLLLITGPNMAGKSVFMRQTAVIVLLAHIGCFVPAKKANIGLVDRIFVRSGASDIISGGLSTFMVEMVETAHILNHATQKSLIIMDEIGRGTSTYDGISIAWAVAEYLVTSKQKAKTLFATHYHELQKLSEVYPDKIKNYQVAIEDNNGEPIFLHKVIKGGASHSFGVAVAKLAGVPGSVTQKAMNILNNLEKKVFHNNDFSDGSNADKHTGENKKFQNKNTNIQKQINDIDLENITPVKALQILAKLQDKIKNG
jgi:DNA mismatch repair protein MutS